MTVYQNKNTKRKFSRLPADWCSQVCTNSMNEVCVTVCAPNRDTSWFELNIRINLEDLPPFPHRSWQEEMTSHERQAVAGLYLAKVVDHIKGIRHEPPIRPHFNRYRNRQISKNLENKNVQSCQSGGDSTSENRKKRADSENGFSKVDGESI